MPACLPLARSACLQLCGGPCVVGLQACNCSHLCACASCCLQAYKQATQLLSASASSLFLLLSWVPKGRASASATGTPASAASPPAEGTASGMILCRQLAPQLRAVQAALAKCCEGLACVVEQKEQFTDALAYLAELESR
jgi:hypothetical protein